MRRLVTAVATALLLFGCATTDLPKPQFLQSCPNGLRMIAHVWSLEALPAHLQEKAKRLMATAERRDTRAGTDPLGYRGDAFSRTLGPELRREGKGRAPITQEIFMVYRDSRGRVAGPLGSMRIERGIGMITLAGDPRASSWILETIWPASFMSPVKSGDERRLWLLPEEWGSHCEMNIHGLVA